MLPYSMNRRSAMQTIAAAAASTALPDISSAKPAKPNFVVIFADDLGYNDLSCYGAPKIRTPHLDQMAEEGMKFESFYVCSAVCTPSRAGLLTGRLPVRSGLTQVLFPFSQDGIDDYEITIAEALKPLGYKTGCFGKWHLGHLPQYLPTRHGFDEYYGIPYSNDMHVIRRGDPPIPLMRNEDVVEQPANQHTITKRYAEEAVSFIKRNKDDPFFVYVPHSMPHIPIFASEDFEGTSAQGLYGDVIEEIDWSVGLILQALKDEGLDENTLVIFTSDNGPWLVMDETGGNADPLRHGKGTLFEGGVRVPCIARWPGQIEAGSVHSSPAWTPDLLPTFVNLAGGTLPGDREYDGYDISGMLLGTGERPDEEFMFYMGNNLNAYRSGKWKIKSPRSGRVYGEPLDHPWLLFDLENDPEEQSNLAYKHPERLQSMRETMEKFHANLGEIPKPKR